MTYRARVFAMLGLFFVAVLAANGFLLHLARDFASEDLHVGQGHSKFPPQILDEKTTKGAR